MKPHKVRFTIWLEPAALDAAKERSRQDGVSVSEALAQAAAESLLRTRQDAEAQVLRAVERVYHLVQRTDRRRGFDDQVLKEMLGLAVLSFFNHTPAVPEGNKRAALLDGKLRFHKFLDTLAANLRGGRSVLSDLPPPSDPPAGHADVQQPNVDELAADHSPAGAPKRSSPPSPPKDGASGAGTLKAAPERAPVRSEANSIESPREPSATPSPPDPSQPKKRWSLFG